MALVFYKYDEICENMPSGENDFFPHWTEMMSVVSVLILMEMNIVRR